MSLLDRALAHATDPPAALLPIDPTMRPGRLDVDRPLLPASWFTALPGVEHRPLSTFPGASDGPPQG